MIETVFINLPMNVSPGIDLCLYNCKHYDDVVRQLFFVYQLARNPAVAILVRGFVFFPTMEPQSLLHLLN
jgi:hypothetical protein